MLFDLLLIVQWVLFGLVASQVIYLAFFALASIPAYKPKLKKGGKPHRFAVLVPGHKED